MIPSRSAAGNFYLEGYPDTEGGGISIARRTIPVSILNTNQERTLQKGLPKTGLFRYNT